MSLLKPIHVALVGSGRGNLRENREDPAPTVWHMRGGGCGVSPLVSIYAMRTSTGTANGGKQCGVPLMRCGGSLTRRGTPRRY